MSERAGRLRRLAAEVRGELDRVQRTVAELGRLDLGRDDRVTLYAAAALLDTFYSGVEKTMRHVATELGGVPTGASWHRTLLDDMTLALPKLRPAALRVESARALGAYLAFRHRFRNLYLFDLEPEPVFHLVRSSAGTWSEVAGDLEAFAAVLEGLADEVERSG